MWFRLERKKSKHKIYLSYLDTSDHDVIIDNSTDEMGWIVEFENSQSGVGFISGKNPYHTSSNENGLSIRTLFVTFRDKYKR